MDEVDISIAFGCLPPNNDNEWLNLSHFVASYNSTYGTNYSLEAFPENEDRSNPQPEILLRDGKATMVIERKVFVWPMNYIRHHQLWHEFNKRFFAKVLEKFADDVYAFEISDAHIPGSKREVVQLVNEVTNCILEHEKLIRHSGGIICVDEPIEWKFYRLPEIELEDYHGESGVEVRLMRPFQHYDSERLAKAWPEIRSELSELIESSAPKFDNFADCHRVLIVEPYTNVLNLSPEMLSQIIHSITVPVNIDQISLAARMELSEGKTVLDYRLVTAGNSP
jgi:hypothetical protein